MARFLDFEELSEGPDVDREITVLCARGYLRFKLAFRNLVEMMAEGSMSMAHTTIMGWAHHHAPEFERRWHRFAQPAEASWRADGTCVTVRGKWVYLYPTVDRARNTVEFRLRANPDIAAAKDFCRTEITCRGSSPPIDTLDGSAASQRAERETKVDSGLPVDTTLRPSRYPNNLIEQNHWGVNSRIAPMLGSSGSEEQQSPLRGLNSHCGSAMASSASVGCVFAIDVRPPSGMQSWQPNKVTASCAHSHNRSLAMLFTPDPQKAH